MSSVIKTAVVAAVVLLSSAVAAQAQTLDVKVPFAFLVGSTQMPAGTYRVVHDSSMGSVVLIRGEHGAQAFVQTTPLKGTSPASDAPALVFVPGERANRLTQIWDSAASGEEIAVHRGKISQVSQIIVYGRSRS
jgi:hypothetical protein